MNLSELPVAAVAQAMSEPDGWRGGMLALALLLAFMSGFLFGRASNRK